MPKILSSNGLKLIAAVSMTVDHIGAALFPQALWLRCIGRLAFVLYAFLITEGYIYTRNVKWYMARLGLLAVLSEVPFDLLFHRSLFYPYAQNVFFTLFLGLLAIYLMDLLGSRLAPGMWFLCLQKPLYRNVPWSRSDFHGYEYNTALGNYSNAPHFPL